ncbi:MAG: SIMPL domain-containing protein [Bacillota bacterium]|nr:SIMPL domain-containing protein [Bacillota bacterium]
MRYRVRILAVVLAVAVLLGGVWVTAIVRGGATRTAAASDFDQSRRISVTGTAEIMIEPNMAQITVGVQSEGATGTEAQGKSDAVMSAIVVKLLASGIRQGDLKTVGFSLYPVYDYRPYDSKEPPVLTPIGFRSSQRLQVTVRDLAKVGAVIDESVKAGANAIEDITFGLSDTAEVRKQALSKAVADAMAKADVIAQAMGVKVVEITSVQEQGVDYGYYKVPAMAERADGMGGAVSMPGEVTVRASIGMVVRY